MYDITALDTLLTRNILNNIATDLGSAVNHVTIYNTACVEQSLTTQLVGFKGSLNVTHAPDAAVYNFYAGGDAPSYFNGGIQFDLTNSSGGTQEQLQLDDYEEGSWTPVPQTVIIGEI